MQYRSKHITEGKLANAWVVRGYQAEIRNETDLPNVAGFIYDEGGKRGRICQVGERVVWTADGKKDLKETFLTQEAFDKIMRVDDWNDVVIAYKRAEEIGSTDRYRMVFWRRQYPEFWWGHFYRAERDRFENTRSRSPWARRSQGAD